MDLRGKSYEELLSEKISQEYWSLEDAVFLVTGESREIKNAVTYQKALKAIKTKLLNAKFEFEEPDFEFHDGGMDGAMRNFLRDEYRTAIQENNFEKASNFYIKPRVFVDWCIKNKIHSTCSDKLFQFFNYDYWLSQEFWEFNQAVLILFSEGNPPLPSQIVNVFEVSELCNSQAKKLAQDLLDTKTRRIDEEWLYWKIKRNDGVEEWASCYPNSYEDFLKERIFLSRNALFRIAKKHEKILSYIPKSLLDKALKIIDKQDVAKIHSNSATEYLLKMIRENSLNLTLNKICTPQEFLKTLAKLPNESGAQNMKILMEIALDEIRGVGLSEEDSRRQSDIKEIRARFENLNEYSFLFKKDRELNKINFLSRGGDEDRGRLVDFIEWAKGYDIPIPLEMVAALQSKELSKNTSPQSENEPKKTDGDEVIFELNLIHTRTNFFVLSIVDFRGGGEIFRSGELNLGGQHGKFILTLCKKFQDNDSEFVQINPEQEGLVIDKSSRASQFPNKLGFKSIHKELKSLFFEGIISNQNVIFYKKITQKRLVEKGLQNKI